MLTFGSLFAGIGGIVYYGAMPRGGKPKVYPEAMVRRVAALYASGMTQAEVSEVLGTSQKVVWNLMRRHNIPTRIAAKRNQSGEHNHMWKGEAAGYQAKHLRIYRLKGQPSECEVCGTTDSERTYDWANVSGDYDDPDSYVRMCRSCHWKFDGTIANVNGGRP